MATESTREARPDARGRNTVRFPESWGEPPANYDTRQRWIAANISRGREAEARGQRPAWLAPQETR